MSYAADGSDARVNSLVLSTADWDCPLWTNKQYVARELAEVGPVLYMNSLGLRRPEFSRSDLRRIATRVGLLANTKIKRPEVEQVQVISPRVIPRHRRSGPTWRLNTLLLHRITRSWHNDRSLPRLLWTFSPVTYGLEKFADIVVYHCVDLLEHVHGVDNLAIQQGEASLRRISGIIPIASSQPIAAHLSGAGFVNVTIWENVADVDVIEREARHARRQPGHIVFAGNLTPQKVDFALLRRLVESNPSVHLHLVGPVAEGGGAVPNLTWFMRHSRVTLHGTLAPAALGRLLGECTVGLIPYQLSSYTIGVFPMKVYEYFAAGLAIVATDLPSLKSVAEIERCASHDAFIRSAVREAQRAPENQVAMRRAVAREHSWFMRGRQIRALITNMLGDV